MTVKYLLMMTVVFFLQPIFLAGLFYAFWNRHKRLTYVRETYRMNFNRSSFEIFDYFFKAIFLGILLSFITLLIGVPITIEWYMLYQLIAVLLLLLGGSRLLHPIFTFSLASLGLFLSDKFNQRMPLDWLVKLRDQRSVQIYFEGTGIHAILFNALFLTILILLGTTFLMRNKDKNKLFPILRSSKRGKLVAKYQNKSLWLLPLAVIVPGSVFDSFAPWWPLFSIGGKEYALLVLPILVGFHYTISTQLIKEANQHLKKDLQILGLAASILLIVSYFYPELTIWLVGLLFLAGLFVLYRHRQRENLWTFKYGPGDEGLRIIAVRPDSPAERMELETGTMITHINDIEINTKDDFYDVITHNRSYIKMRLKRSDGEIIMAETPLYDDDANSLGLLVI